MERNSTARELTIFRSVGAFCVSEGREILVDLEDGADPDITRVLLLGRVTAQLMRQRGWFPLHASAVLVGDQACLFLASSGTGKSTLAAAFHRRGHSVLSDDVSPVRVALGRCFLRPGASRLRLLSDAAAVFSDLDPDARVQTDKHAFALRSEDRSGDIPVKRIYAVEDVDILAIEDVLPFYAVQVLGRECFVRLRAAGPDLLAVHLQASVRVAELGLVRRLVRPRRMEALDQVVRAIEADLDASQPSIGQAR